MRADERFANPGDVIQGGFSCAFLDSAMGASAVTSLEGRRARVANAEMKVSFFRSAKVGSDFEPAGRRPSSRVRR
jgi:acyl-coenzyme A thioesterase PaaI-like protein